MHYYTLPQESAQTRFSIILTGLSAAILLLTLSAYVVDERLLGDAPVWAKPAKFASSFVVLFATIAWLETRLSEPWRDGWLLSATLVVMGTALVAEMGYIIFQAAQAEASHFNYATPFHAFMYTTVMFVGALALVAAIGIYGFAAALDKEAELPPGVRWGVVWGFALSFVLTVIVAGYMGGQSGHHVGTPSLDAARIPFLGWSGEVGDLRPAHFLSLHAMQALPLFGWVVDRQNLARPRYAVSVAAVIYTVLTLAVFAQALAGQPLIRL
ncbi:MAG: hypothetical protein AAGF94_05355 [Pseudomonadota bacterium]